ncbi:MAG: SGNH/GDSL hydrolase family protein [Lachnospiraceae bacterium]|nr:SGNH/GDSL hydrolase family protein [Lachnospiraceae bacterium]
MESRLENREETEWTNCWWAKANSDTKRIALIGDSVTRQFRGVMEQFAQGVYAVDLFATSLYITDPLLKKHLSGFFDTEYTYDTVILNYGYHHGLKFSELIYKEMLENIIMDISTKTGKLVLWGGTYETTDSLERKQRNKEIERRNKISKQIAEEMYCEFFDLNEVANKEGIVLKYTDSIHLDIETVIQLCHCLYLENGLAYSNILHDRLLSKLNDKGIIIYGVGTLAEKLFWYISVEIGKDNIFSFAESKSVHMNSRFCEKDVYCIEDLYETYNEALVIVASQKHSDEMMRNVIELGFENVLNGSYLIK